MRPSLPPRRASQADVSGSEAEEEKPMGIAARIASLNLSQINQQPPKGPPPPPGQQPKEEQAPAVPRRRLPPMPTRLPTPPPEVELEPEPEQEAPATSESEQVDCIKCRNFSHVDEYVEQFPRHTVASLEELAWNLCEPFPDEIEKARAIFFWLHLNVAYDAHNFLNGTVTHKSPQDVLREGLAVCDGYAGLFKALADLAGLQCHRIAGHVAGVQATLMQAGVYQKALNPTWFSSTPWEFGKKHYPEDPSYRLLDDDLSWESYIREPAGPTIFGSYYANGFHAFYLEPWASSVPAGIIGTVFINLPDNSRHPLYQTEEGGWAVEVYIPPTPGEVSLYSLDTLDHQDAMGIGPDVFVQSIGRKAMSFQGLARWTIQ
ncbi:hypothetical protein DL96DRAFT_1555559 [Flagelloscypha sp. PMI_526]|nr:hypothetical protein DL96DRAFT_1555559 [Flagelloscypha sp. PMI_526]